MGGEQSEVVRLLWGPHPKPARGPRPTVDLDRIARAGIEIADSDGLAEVSMQRVAARLGLTKMALYRYVPGKAELVALMVDAALGPCPPPTAWQDGGWRDQLEEWARRLFTVLSHHPWVLDAAVGPRVMGPGELSWMDRAVSALGGTGLNGAERLDAAFLLVSHVRGIVQQAHAAGPAGNPEAQLGAILGDLTQAHGERFPAFTAALASTGRADGEDQAWEFGLQRVLDGLTVYMDRDAR